MVNTSLPFDKIKMFPKEFYQITQRKTPTRGEPRGTEGTPEPLSTVRMDLLWPRSAVQPQITWPECLRPCPGLSPLWGAQPSQKETVSLLKTRPSPPWLDKVMAAGKRPKEEKKNNETASLSPRYTAQLHPVHNPGSLWPFLVPVPPLECPSSLCFSG